MLDLRHNRLGSASQRAADHVETALRQMMSFHDSPQAELEAAQAADPGWALPLLMSAGDLLHPADRASLPQAQALLAQAAPRCEGAPARERAHLEALRALADGRLHQACRLWDEWLLEHPRDALALLWAHQADLQRGDTAALRLRPARALPEWDEADPLYPQVLALHAFGLAEANLYPQAEDSGRRAVALDPDVPWAVLAVAQVMDRQGRFEDGTAWLRQHQPAWAEGNRLASRLWWLMGLFRLEAMDLPGVHRLIDAHLCGAALQTRQHRVDAASLLWRLHLLGEDVGARFVDLLRDWAPVEDDAGHHAFHDLHVLLAMLGAGEWARAESWLARCAARAMQAEDARRSNHAVAREVGLPLMRGLLALAHGDAAAAVASLHSVQALTPRLGGSQTQRELFDLSLLVASARAPGHAIGQALLNERLMAKPLTPLTRHWGALLGRALG